MIKKHYLLIVLLVLAIFLRLLNLGYSDFQGDEIKALFIPEPGQSISDFLLTQRKGPVQFLVTYLITFASPDYSSEFITRLPFALAGILAVFFFYKFLLLEFDKKLAFFATFFLVTNGFFIAFSRIVQYQSFVIMFMIAALYFFSLASRSKEWAVKGIYVGFILWALSILSHYDGVFIFPYVAYLLFRWSKKQVFDFSNVLEMFKFKSIFKNFRHLLLSGLIFIFLLVLFYIPFVFNLDDATKNYWAGRLEGTGDKLASSVYLFSVYQPIYVFEMYLVLFILGVFQFLKRFIGFELLMSVAKSRFKNIGTLLVLTFSDNFHKVVALNVWFLVAFLFFEGLVSIPGTHIYTYLLPMFIYLGFGVVMIDQLLQRLLKHFGLVISTVGIAIVFAFIFFQSFAVFVDHTKEYPWRNEKFLLWTLPAPSPVYHLSMFGFPYYRHWEEIADFILSDSGVVPCPRNKPLETCTHGNDKVTFYSTNERDSIARYHIPYSKETNKAGYYVYIRDPQSFSHELNQEKVEYWAANYPAVLTLTNCQEDMLSGNFSDILGLHKGSCKAVSETVAEVHYMAPGGLVPIQELGY